MMSSTTRIKCLMCSYQTSKQLEFIKHAFSSHSMDLSFIFHCGIEGCLHSFKYGSTYCSFKTHAIRKHRNWQQQVNSRSTSIDVTESTTRTRSSQTLHGLTDETEMDFSLCDEIDLPITSSISSDPGNEHSTRTPEETAALFLLSYKEKYRLSQTAINYAVGSINSICENVCSNIRQSIETQHQKNGSISMTDVDECFVVNDPFAGIGTEYLQSKFYRENFGLVVISFPLLMFNVITVQLIL